MLDNVELRKTYVLNPLAPEFVPKSRRVPAQAPNLGANVSDLGKDPALLMSLLMQDISRRGSMWQLPPHQNIPITMAMRMPRVPQPIPWLLTRPPPLNQPLLPLGPHPGLLNMPPPPPPPHPQLPLPTGLAVPPPPPPSGSMFPVTASGRGPGVGGHMAPPPPPLPGFFSNAHPTAPGSSRSQTPVPRPGSNMGWTPGVPSSSLLGQPLMSNGSEGPKATLGAPINAPSTPLTPSALTGASKKPTFFFKEGVHFPAAPVVKKEPAPAKTCSDLLPEDVDINLLIRSPQLQIAWYNHLTLTKGKIEADNFKSFMTMLTENSQLASTASSMASSRSGSMSNYNTVPNSRSSGMPTANKASGSGPIHLKELEAIFHQDGGRNNEAVVSSVLSDILKSSDDSDSPDSGCYESQGSGKHRKLLRERGKSASPMMASGLSTSDYFPRQESNLPLYMRKPEMLQHQQQPHQEHPPNNQQQQQTFAWPQLSQDRFLFDRSRFNIQPCATSSLDVPASTASGSNIPSYASVLRTQKSPSSGNSTNTSDDPLSRIRDLGTQATLGQRGYQNQQGAEKPSQQPFSGSHGLW